MLRFCDAEPHALISHFLTVTVDARDLAVSVKQILPSGAPDRRLLENVTLFAFPDKCSIESKSLIVFVIGDICCEFRLGFVFYRTSLSGYCVITDYYYPKLFKYVLSLPEEHMMTQINLLILKKSRVTFSAGNRTFYLDGGTERQDSLAFIFKRFSGFDISKIIIGMLQARHIFVVSSSAAICSHLAAALNLLIDPFRWDMNCIPVLPLKLKEATQVPVPTVIGLTQGEVLLEGRVGSRVIVHADLRIVIDSFIDAPAVEASNPEVIQIQTDFHRNVHSQLKAFEGCPGFPHKHMGRLMRYFIFQYLMVYTGSVTDKTELLASLRKLPECLATSQVLQDLFHLENSSDKVKSRIEEWIEEVSSQSLANSKRHPSKSPSLVGLDSSKSPEKPPLVQSTSLDPVSSGPFIDILGSKPRVKNPAPPEDNWLIDFGGDDPKLAASSPGKQKGPSDDLLHLFESSPVATPKSQRGQGDDVFGIFDGKPSGVSKGVRRSLGANRGAQSQSVLPDPSDLLYFDKG
jgi:hypothetical protein